MNSNRLEADLACQVRDLMKSNLELQKFAYVVSHDLKEPLRMVSSYVRLLELKYKDRLDADATKYIKYVVEGSKKMQSLIDDLLLYSRIESLELDLQLTNLNQLVSQLKADLSKPVLEAGAELRWDDLPTIKADSSQLREVLHSLVTNGIKFRGNEKPKVHIAATRSNEGWIIAVQDNGIGVESKHFERIFGVFNRLHTSEQYPGTGIGLALAKKIVERHGGRIWIESNVGEGSTFSFLLPS